MTHLGVFFQAERVKWRKSWLLLTAILAPLCQTGFLGILFWFSENRIRMFRPGFQFWLELNFVAWNLILMPVVAALVCELSWEQERHAKAWNLLLIQPAPRWVHFLVKVLSHTALLILSQVLLTLLVLLGGFVLRLKAELLMGPLPLHSLGRFLGYSILSFMAVTSFHTWLSMRVPGPWTSLAVALGGSWFSLRLVGLSPWMQLLPWGMASHMSIVFERWRALPWGFSLGSLLCAGTMIAIGALDFSRHRETQD
jgi:hypothetical protein